MGDYSIGGKNVADPIARGALKVVFSQGYFKGKIGRDKDLSETELGNTLDLYEPGKNVINGSDLSTSTFLKNTGLTEEQFIALAREYHKRFPNGAKKVNTSLWKAVYLEKQYQTTPKNCLLAHVAKSDFIFVGDAHGVHDEKVFIGLMGDLRQAGVTKLAVEISIDQQKAMDSFLATGDATGFTSPYDKIIKLEKGLVELIKAAHKAGISIVCVDQPLAKQTSKAKRDKFISLELQKLKKGKTLIWMGSSHAALEKTPYPSARSLLKDSGHKTSGMKLESQSAAKFAKDLGHSNSRMLHHAVYNYFNSSGPSTTIAYPTSEMGLLRFFDPTPDSRKSTNHLSYKDAFDSVIFLSQSDSKRLY